MKTKKEIKKWLLENCVDKDGDLDLSNLDFSDFDRNVFIAGMKVKKDLFQGFQRVNGNLIQHHQKVKGNLYQDCQKVNSNLHQEDQIVEGTIFQDNIENKENKNENSN